MFFTREIWRRLWHCIMQHCIRPILNANKAVGCGFFCRSNLDKSRPEAGGDVISGRFVGPVVLDKYVKFRDPSSNREKFPTKRYFRQFFFHYNFRQEVDDVISGVAVDNVSMDVPGKFGDSRSNGFRDIGGPHLVSNERTWRSLTITWSLLESCWPNGEFG